MDQPDWKTRSHGIMRNAGIARAKRGAKGVRLAGFIVLASGLFAAAITGGLLLWLFPAGPIGWILGIGIALLSTAIATALIAGGRKLEGVVKADEAFDHEATARAYASEHGGEITAAEAAHALHCSYNDADAFLTSLAKSRPEEVTVDVRDDGALVFRFLGVRARVAVTTSEGEPAEEGAYEEGASSPRSARR